VLAELARLRWSSGLGADTGAPWIKPVFKGIGKAEVRPAQLRWICRSFSGFIDRPYEHGVLLTDVPLTGTINSLLSSGQVSQLKLCF